MSLLEDEIKPTPRNYILGLLADAAQRANETVSRPAGYDNPPGRMLMSLLGVPAIAQTLDRLSYGEPLTTGRGMTTKVRPEAMEAAMAIAPGVGPATKATAKAAKAAAKELGPKAADIAERYMMEQGLALPIYLPHTPLKPDPRVGKRFEQEFVGNMAPKTQIKIDDLIGSNVMLTPWDSTSRGYKIKNVSDEVLPSPVITTGGQDYARDMAHMAQDIGGASGTGIAKRVVDRFKQAQIENAQKGGGGDVFFMPSTMSRDSEFFSSMPTDILLQLIKKADPSMKDIAFLDDALRNAPVATPKGLVRPFQNFQGILTPEGQAQLFTGAGFGAKGTPGNFRKAFTEEMYKVRNQKDFGFNREDVTNAVTDAALMGLPKGMMGNTVVRAIPERGVAPSTDRAYPSNFFGDYVGSLGLSLPAEVLMPKTYGVIFNEMKKKYPGKPDEAIHSMTLGALEKRKENVSEFVDQQVIDSVYNYLSGNRAPIGLLLP